MGIRNNNFPSLLIPPFQFRETNKNLKSYTQNLLSMITFTYLMVYNYMYHFLAQKMLLHLHLPMFSNLIVIITINWYQQHPKCNGMHHWWVEPVNFANYNNR